MVWQYDYRFTSPDEKKKNSELLHRLKKYDPYESSYKRQKRIQKQSMYALAA